MKTSPYSLRSLFFICFPILLSACAETGTAEEEVALDRSNLEARLHGEWLNAYITDHSTTRWSLQFKPEGRLIRGYSHWDVFDEEPGVESSSEGTHTLTSQGAVVYSWTLDGKTEHRTHTASLVEGRALLDPCCQLNATHGDVWWSHRGYLAALFPGRNFVREDEQSTETHEALTRYARTETRLAFSPSLANTLSSGSCHLNVDILIEHLDEASGEILRADEHFEWGCSHTRLESGLIELRVNGLDDFESPYLARGVWRDHLEALALKERLAPSLLRRLQNAFEPLMYWDPQRPEVLFHPLDDYSDDSGYARQPKSEDFSTRP